jgi:hypothetical protein
MISPGRIGMRLRQIALVAYDLEPVAAQLNAVFGLRVAFRDPAVARYGLINVVMPVGGEFLEIVQPVTADASAGRYLTRRGGDAGYMLIFQAGDAVAHRARLAGEGIRNIAQLDSPRYTFTHFHPGDFDGVLVSVDTAGNGSDWRERFGHWPPAGPDWRSHSADPGVLGIAGAIVQVTNPLAVAQRWSHLLEAERDGKALRFDGGLVRFVEPVDPDGTGIVGVRIAVRDPAAILARASSCGIHVTADAVRIGGVAFVPADRET